MGLLYLGLLLCDVILTKGLKTLKSEDFADWTLLMSGQLDQEIIILGNSRALYHFNPEIISDSLGFTAYNLGIDGAKTAMMETRLKSLFKHNKPPKYIIHTFDHSHLGLSEYIFQKHQFLPYLKEDQIYYPLKKIDPDLFFDRYIPLWRYHGFGYLFSNGIKALIIPETLKVTTSINGFLPQHKEWNNDFRKFIVEHWGDTLVYSDNDIKLGFDYLDMLIDLCKKHNTKLILVYPPQYNELTSIIPQDDYISDKVVDISTKENIHYLSYKYLFSDDTSKFYNSTHLNYIGADEFTSVLSHDLNVFFQDNGYY